ncbi:MAG: glycosyltransferase family 39 protein [Actinomycetes bacterium]
MNRHLYQGAKLAADGVAATRTPEGSSPLTVPTVPAADPAEPTDPPADSRSRRRGLSAGFVLPLVFGLLGVAVYSLWYWNPAYRYDEYLVAVTRTRLPWRELLSIITTTDPGPGPLYLLMKPWTAVSSDPNWTRVPSVCAMAIAVAALVALAQRATDRTTAVFAGVTMLALPATSLWAQDNRMYALATMCTVLAVALWWRSIGSASRWWSVGYGVAVAGMGLFHLYSLTVLPVLLAVALLIPVKVAGHGRRVALLKTLIPAAIAFVVLLPHIYLNLRHPTGSPSNPPLTLGSLSDIFLESFGGRWLAALVILLCLTGMIFGWLTPNQRPVVLLAVGWALFPLLCFMVARGLFGIPTLIARYYVFAIPGACLLAALGLAALFRWWWPAAVVIAALVVVAGIPEQVAVRSVDSHRVDAYRIVELIRQPALAGLPVVAANEKLGLRVDAASYPQTLLTGWNAAATPVAVVVDEVAGTTNPQIPYLTAGNPWATVVRCAVGSVGSVSIVALPQAQIPLGTPTELAQTLNAAVPGARCAPKVY